MVPDKKNNDKGHVCRSTDHLARLFCAGRSGDKSAMDELMALAHPKLIKVVDARLYLQQRSQGFADIVASQILLKVLDNPQLFDCSREFMPWVKGFVRNEM